MHLSLLASQFGRSFCFVLSSSNAIQINPQLQGMSERDMDASLEYFRSKLLYDQTIEKYSHTSYVIQFPFLFLRMSLVLIQLSHYTLIRDRVWCANTHNNDS